MLTLQCKAVFEGVQNLTFSDSIEEPYFFTVKVSCQGCRSIHSNAVSFSRYDNESLPGSRGEANFVMKCHECGKDGNISVVSKTLGVYNGEDKFTDMATFDCRGLVIEEFEAGDDFKAEGLDTNTKFNVSFDDGEWYDVDEKSLEQVSITELQWKIVKTK
ncbi:hypothetical protein DASB73_019170 [Starmerella bacillaris]|uniref:Uncharacterized protein n=1 Tax=Starmerella bacillaris TaxID=1247836 RepID=A0AAV5RK70_STABA|nr:hypothetical protein DASB73_019170 [Starmerella bacillaris]